jgi:hypothetical protein
MSPAAAAYWQERLGNLRPELLRSIVWSLPSAVVSEPARLFALEIMLQNRKRLLASE